eukprot:4869765-Prymnesium_polylepis.1
MPVSSIAPAAAITHAPRSQSDHAPSLARAAAQHALPSGKPALRGQPRPGRLHPTAVPPPL